MNRLHNPDDTHTMLLLVDEQGTVIKSLHDPSGKVVESISEGLELDNKLIMGSFFASFMTTMTLNWF